MAAVQQTLTMSFMDRSITVTDEEYNTLMLALDVTAARYEEKLNQNPTWFLEQSKWVWLL